MLSISELKEPRKDFIGTIRCIYIMNMFVLVERFLKHLHLKFERSIKKIIINIQNKTIKLTALFGFFLSPFCLLQTI